MAIKNKTKWGAKTFLGDLSKTERHLVIKLPKNLFGKGDLNNKVFCIQVGQTIQITLKRPDMIVPFFADVDEFVRA